MNLDEATLAPGEWEDPKTAVPEAGRTCITLHAALQKVLVDSGEG